MKRCVGIAEPDLTRQPTLLANEIVAAEQINAPVMILTANPRFLIMLVLRLLSSGHQVVSLTFRWA